MTHLHVLAVMCALSACVGRRDEPPASPAGPPFVAWLESEPHADGERLTLVVLPTRALAAPVHVRVTGLATRSALIGARGGRHDFALERAEHVRVEAWWRDPRGVAGARAVLEHPAVVVTAPTFVPIVRHQLGRSGPTIDQAVRLR